MFKYYTSIVFITIFIMLTMISIVKNSNNLPKDKKVGFTIIFVLVAIVSISEWLGAYFNENNLDTVNLRTLHIAVKTVEFSIAPVITVVYIMTISSIHPLKKYRFILPIMIINLILEILNCKFGFIFYVDNLNIYHRNNYYWIYMLCYTYSIIYLYFKCYTISKIYQNKNGLCLILILTFLLLGTSIQVVNSELKVDWLVTSISTILFYIYYSEMIQQMDALTFLLNRRSYESKLSNIHIPVVVVFFDVNKFKNINDTYGHSMGDTCLKEISNQIKKIYGKYGFCYRIGGDEFCAILHKHVTSMENLNEDFKKSLEVRRKEIDCLPSVAIGYSIYHPSTDNIDEVISKVDSIMYENKKSSR